MDVHSDFDSRPGAELCIGSQSKGVVERALPNKTVKDVETRIQTEDRDTKSRLSPWPWEDRVRPVLLCRLESGTIHEGMGRLGGTIV